VYFTQFYLGCLAQASYLIGSESEAAVVDPRRDVDEYIQEAEARGLAIRWVIETHLHADFVSGHRELAERTGATIVIGARAQATFPHRAAHDGDEIAVGRLTLRILETPGHTPDSICVEVVDPGSSPEPRMVLTGDTLFVGDVGRPDLVGAQGFSSEDMAGMLYDSLHRKLLRLPDSVEVYPAHGAGSLCGRNISRETSSTIGEQRRANAALQPMGREEFVRWVTTDLPEIPAHFPLDVALNREGAESISDRPLPPGLSAADVEGHAAAGGVVLDVRTGTAFGAGHVPDSVNIDLDGEFAPWAGALIPADLPVVVVAEDEARVREATMRLARVGLEKVVGHLVEGARAWRASGRALATVAQIPVSELRERVSGGSNGLQVIDVRRPREYAEGHVPGATPLPLDRLDAGSARLDASRPMALVCGSGYRSSTAASLLRRRGFEAIHNVVGGTAAWTAAGYPVERAT
jgi:glyoxylase-like metal-dependent hydrolase (beta-lactamase superfamily II)/rhodanese-related sulfurtransferase